MFKESDFLKNYLAQKEIEQGVGEKLISPAMNTYMGPGYMRSAETAAAPAAAPAAATSAAALPFLATPAGAGVMIGSQILSGYMQQRAADERARRERAASIAQEHGLQEQRGFQNLIDVYRSALT